MQRGTSPDVGLPWARPPEPDEATHPCLVLVWSLDEPERVGEIIVVRKACSVGRGLAMDEDPEPRAHPVRVRPGRTLPCPPLANARISRLQWTLRPAPRGATGCIELASHGRTPTLVNGQPVERATLAPNDVVELRNAAIFLVAERRPRLPAMRSDALPSFDFGERDAFGLVGESEAAWNLRDELAFVARSTRHVLLLGQTGTGKELAAQAIHGLSDRRGKTFVSRNAATLPEGIIDAELFGSAKSYPNAGMPERVGLLGEADESTLFLDEIGDLPENLQVHLLRALDTAGEYQRLGESKMRRSSFRLVAATNRPLESLKHDFLARFTHRITLVGLDERRDDLPMMIRALLLRAGRADASIAERFFERRQGALAEPRITPTLMGRLLRHRYTGNVRELDRLLWLAMSSTREDYLDLTPALEAELPAPRAEVESTDVSREAIERALQAHGGSVSAAARALSLRNRFVLHRLMKKHGLSTPDDGGA